MREIMRVPGVDVVLIGPFDLLTDVRANGHDEAHHERLVLEVAAASKETGTPAGYVCATPEMAERRLAQGFRFINYGLDHFVLLGGMRAIREQARQWTAPTGERVAAAPGRRRSRRAGSAAPAAAGAVPRPGEAFGDQRVGERAPVALEHAQLAAVAVLVARAALDQRERPGVDQLHQPARRPLPERGLGRRSAG